MTSGKLSFLRSSLNHDTYRGISEWEEKLERYAQWQAQDYSQKVGKVTLFHTLIKPAFRFFKHYILSGGFLDGYIGFRISKYAAWSVWLRYKKVIEIRSNR